MGRVIEQGYYKETNFWIGNEIAPPNANYRLEKIDNGTAFSRKILETQRIHSQLPNYWLATGSAKVFSELLPLMERVALKGGDYLYHSGEKVDYIYFPETAVMSEFQILEDGRTLEISMTGREGIMGFLPIYSSHTNTNWTQVSVPGTAVRITSRLFENELQKNSPLQSLLFSYLSDYVGQISQRAVCNSYHSIEQRFCSWLLMLQDRRESSCFPLTQEQIARSLGAHRPSVTHIAQNLRERKIIDYVRGKIFIKNRMELENSACCCHMEIDKSLFLRFNALLKAETQVM